MTTPVDIQRPTPRAQVPRRVYAYGAIWILLIVLAALLAWPEPEPKPRGATIKVAAVEAAFRQQGRELQSEEGADGKLGRFVFGLQSGHIVRIDAYADAEQAARVAGAAAIADDDCNGAPCRIRFSTCNVVADIASGIGFGAGSPRESQPLSQTRPEVEGALEKVCDRGEATLQGVADAFWEGDEFRYAVTYSYESVLPPHVALGGRVFTDPKALRPTVRVFRDVATAEVAFEQLDGDRVGYADENPRWHPGDSEVSWFGQPGRLLMRACNVVAHTDGGSVMFEDGVVEVGPGIAQDPAAAGIGAAVPAPDAVPRVTPAELRGARSDLRAAMRDLRDGCGG